MEELKNKKEKPFIEIAKEKYKGYKPIGYGGAMQQYINWIKRWSVNLKIENIFEIGANFGQDADYLRNAFNLTSEDVYVFEAHPEIYKTMTEIHNFHAYNKAVYNKKGIVSFNIVPRDSDNSGISSILSLKHTETKEVKVESIRMDDFLNTNNIKSVDFLKLDVEGVNYEALEGFGDRLKDIKVIQTEAEHVCNYDYVEKNKLFDDIKSLLEANDFSLVIFERYGIQSDSLWVQNKYIYH